MNTMGTFPLPAGGTFDAHMYSELHDGIETWCNKHFGTMQIQHSAAMPLGSHILRIAVKRVYDRTRTWMYDDDHEHGGCFRNDPERPNDTSEQEGENYIDRVCLILHLVAPCTQVQVQIRRPLQVLSAHRLVLGLGVRCRPFKLRTGVLTLRAFGRCLRS